MSQKSLNTLLKAQISDERLPIRERKIALRKLPRPSKRFLRSLIENPGTPVELRQAATRRWVESIGPQHSEIGIRPHPENKTPNAVTEPTPPADGELPVMDPAIWELTGGSPHFRKGPRTAETLEIEARFERVLNELKSPQGSKPNPVSHSKDH